MDRCNVLVLGFLAATGVFVAMDGRAEGSAVITFEDTHTAAEQPLYNGYGGLDWQNVETMNTDWWVSDRDPINGYVNGATSPPTVAWVPVDAPFVDRATATISSSTPFAFESAELTSAWNDNLVLKVIAYLNGQVVGSQTVTLNPSGPTLVNFDFAKVDTVRLSASGGTYDPAFNSSPGSAPAPIWVMDDVTVGDPGTVTTGSPSPGPPSPVPEPSGFAIAGLLAVAGWFYRNRKC